MTTVSSTACSAHPALRTFQSVLLIFLALLSVSYAMVNPLPDIRAIVSRSVSPPTDAKTSLYRNVSIVPRGGGSGAEPRGEPRGFFPSVTDGDEFSLDSLLRKRIRPMLGWAYEYWHGRFGDDRADRIRPAGNIDVDEISVGLAIGVGRAARLALLVIVLSEALNFAGFFIDADGERAKSRAREFMHRCDVGGKAGRAREGAERWWDGARSFGGILHADTWEDRFVTGHAFREDVSDPVFAFYKNLPYKTKFAIGAALGLTSFRPILSLTKTAALWGSVAYVTAECTCSCLGRRRGRVRVNDIFNTDSFRRADLDVEAEDIIRRMKEGLRCLGQRTKDGFDYVEDSLDSLRMRVRRVARNPMIFLDRINVIIDDHSDLIPGILVGSVLGFLFQ